VFVFREDAMPKFLYPLYIDDGGDGSGGGGDNAGDNDGHDNSGGADDKAGDINPDKIKDFSDDDGSGKKTDDTQAKKSDDADGDADGAAEIKVAQAGLDKLLAARDGKKDDDKSKGDLNFDHLPQHLRGKDATDTIEKLYKAYQGQRNKGTAPEDVADYKLDLPENVSNLINPDSDDDKPLFVAIKDLAKENGLSTDQYNKFIGGLLGKFQEMGLVEVPIDPDEQFKLIGGKGGIKKGQQIAEVTNNFLEGLYRKEIFDKDEFVEAKIMAGTGMGIRVMMKLRGLAGFQEIPTNFESQDGGNTRAELQSRLADPRQKNDPAFQKETDKLYEEKYGK